MDLNYLSYWKREFSKEEERKENLYRKRMKRFTLIRLALLFILTHLLLVLLLTPCVLAQPKNDEITSLHFGVAFSEVPMWTQITEYIGVSLIDYLEGNLNIKVYPKFFLDARSLVQEMKQGKIDVAIASPITYLRLRQAIGVTPALTPLINGKATTLLYIFVSKGSGIKKIEDLKGKTLIYYDKSSANYLFLESLLREKGLGEPEHFFSSSNKASSRISAVYAVLFKKADVVVEIEEVLTVSRFKKNLIPIYKFDSPIPNDLIFYRKDLNLQLVKKIKKMFLKKRGGDILKKLNVNSSPLIKEMSKTLSSLRLVPCPDSNYDSFRKVLKELGIKY